MGICQRKFAPTYFMIFNQLNVEEVGGRRRLAELDELLRIKPNFSPLTFSHTDKVNIFSTMSTKSGMCEPFQEYDNYFRTMSTNAV